MIMVIGEYYKAINKDETSLAGLGYDVSKEIAKNNSSVMFVSRISDDELGLKVLDVLIDNEILFEPSLCNSNLVTPQINFTNQKENPVFDDYYKTILAPYTKEELVEIFEMQDDISVIHFGLLPIIENKEKIELIEAINTIKLSPVKFFNLSSDVNIFYDSNTVDSLIRFSNIVFLNSNTLRKYEQHLPLDQALIKFKKEYKEVSILYYDDNSICYMSSANSDKSINIYKKYKSNKMNINNIISATFLSYMHNNEYFGDIFEAPKLVENYSAIDESLNTIIKVLESD